MRGAPAEAGGEAGRRGNDLAPGGSFVFNTVQINQADVPERNVEAMYEALAEYGNHR